MDDQDCVFLNGLALSAVIGLDAWHRPNKAQPVILDVKVLTDVQNAAETDDVTKSVHYGTLCKIISNTVTAGGHFKDLKALADDVCSDALAIIKSDTIIELTATLPKAVLLAEGGYGIFQSWKIHKSSSSSAAADFDALQDLSLFLNDAKIPCIIGVNPHERLEKQIVILNITVRHFERDFVASDLGAYFTSIIEYVGKSSYETLEALAVATAELVIRQSKAGKATVSVQKPSALTFVKGSGVQISRTRESFQKDD